MRAQRPRRALLALVALLALLPVLAAAQAWPSQGGSQVSAPTASRLRVSAKNDLVVLTWLDSPGSTARYAIYRSRTQLDAADFGGAVLLGDVGPGVQTFTDTPPDSASYYYGVFALGADGKPSLSFIPAATITTVPVAVAATPAPAAAATAAPAAVPPAPEAQPSATAGAAVAAEAQAGVSGISAKPQGEGILVSYQAQPQSRLVLYRGVSKILAPSDLLDATLVAAFADKDGSFLDYPVPGVDYYYAILGEEDLKAGRIALIEGVNTLTAPVQLPASASTAGIPGTPPPPRTPPLPYFLMENGVSGAALPADEGLPPTVPVSPDTEKAIASILARAPAIQPELPSTKILKEELLPPSGGEDYALSLIVSDKIASQDWNTAIDQLRKYLSLNRGPKAAARAHFYLGEALSFTGAGREAFFEFLLARELYPVDARPWIDYVLSSLQAQGG